MLDPLDGFYPYHEDTVTESDWHFSAIQYLTLALRRHFAERPDAHAFSNMFIYDQEGNAQRNVSPDVFVCFGCTKDKRRVYKTWQDGGPPVAVVEVTSRATRQADQVAKRQRYAEMGVHEYVLFDPLGEYLRPTKLRVFRREGDDLVPVLLSETRYRSELLGVELVVEGELLRLIDLRSGKPYLTPEEVHLLVDQEKARAETERRLREELEEHVRQLEQRLGSL